MKLYFFLIQDQNLFVINMKIVKLMYEGLKKSNFYKKAAWWANTVDVISSGPPFTEGGIFHSKR